ncbi:helix-turn-helix domain-containing protein [Paracoccus sp. ME4]|uniref:helix-turn-helix domain-containing protein n=1 Tax=Paracoccus sp. ME4 TaxID=3138066 RepID=UPI00398B7E7E
MLETLPGLAPDFQMRLDEELRDIATSGYSLITQSAGSLMGEIYTTTDKSWMPTYASRHLWVVDPVIRFACCGIGMKTFEDIFAESPVPAGYASDLIDRCGFNYGTVIADRRQDGSKCALIVNRPDRKLTDDENQTIATILARIIEHLDSFMGLSQADLAMLRLLSEGLDQETIAYRMCVSRDAVKKRIDRVRRRMGARNATHAVSLALKNNLLV